MPSVVPSNRPRQTARGFTLVELLLVLVIAVLLGAMAAPVLTGMLASVRLGGAAERLQSEWAAARLDAIRTGEPVAFQCVLGSNVYTVSPLEQATEAASAAAGAEEQLSDVVFRQLSLGDPAFPAEIDPSVAAVLVFQPNGQTQDAFAVVESESGRQRRVVLRGLTGGSRVEEVSTGAAP